MKKIRLGNLLLERAVATKEQLEEAYAQQKNTGEKLGTTLINMGVIEEAGLLTLLAEQLAIPYIKLSHYEVDVELALLLPETYARRFRAMILGQRGSDLLVGLADPLDIYAIDELTSLLNRTLIFAVVSESQLISLIDKTYRHTQEITNFAEELSGEITEQEEVSSLFGETVDAEDAPVVKLLLSLFKDAVIAGASDIHIEPGEKLLRIRMRVDGMLQENILDDSRIARPLVQRLKMRANLDISERRIPQDGRFHLLIHGKSFDVRVSTLPTATGESVVMRLLDQSSPIQELNQLGMPPELVKRVEKIYSEPHGMLLVTGPTGSGKTTTLYSILSKLNRSSQKIITVEDPVEYKLPRINQVQVNAKIHLDFSCVLRAALRQDPDVIMLGEIRDQETSTIAMRAAVTGHFVMATLHTNDAMSSALRLLDMGGKGYMVASSLRGILAQRLVRLLCLQCAKPYSPSQEEVFWLSSEDSTTTLQIKAPEGCSHCNHTGYKGRKGIYEFLAMNEAMVNALRAEDLYGFSKAVKEDPHFISLKESVLALVKQGDTSLQEAIRIVGSLN